jgi:ABC-type branched-subunit amino acid transport system ATPase component
MGKVSIQMILSLKNITISFAKGKDSFRVLNEFNLDVEEGKITALIGGNGTGKTTLFNIISGFQRDYIGDVSFNGKSIKNLSPFQRASKGIGRLFQSNGLFSNLTLLENMKLADKDASGEVPLTTLFNKKKINQMEEKKREKAIRILNRIFGMNNPYIEKLNESGGSFSYGEQRILALAQLFMGNHSLLLLDEPTAGVNIIYLETIKQIIKEMVTGGATVLFIEHNIPFVSEVADYCAFVQNGKIEMQDNTRELLNHQSVKNSYLGIK